MQTLKDFINGTLIREIAEIQDSGHHYLSFGLIAQGIEFLGACIDTNDDYFALNRSGARFRQAITDLFPAGYQPYNAQGDPHYLYSDLRCGLLHAVLPKPALELIQEAEIPDYGNHLEIRDVRGTQSLILVSQQLYYDFKKACEKVIEKIDNGEINNRDLLAVTP